MSEGIPYLSVSKMGTFTKCGLQGKFRYLDKIPEPALGVFLFGKVIHSAIEKALKIVLAEKSAPSLADMTDWLPDLWEEQIKEDEGRAGFTGWHWGEDDSLARGKKEAPQVVQVFHEHVLKTVRPLLIEHKFNFPLQSKVGEFKIYGVLDCLDKGGLLTDWKTADGSPSENQKKLDLQFMGYSLFVREYLDTTDDTDCRKVFLIRGKKKPEIVSYRIHDGHRQWFKDQAARVWQMIQADAYVANTNGWWCAKKWCSFWEGCQGEMK